MNVSVSYWYRSN